jgi:hypothetical protein
MELMIFELLPVADLGDRPAPAMRENSQRWHTRANDTYVYLDSVLIPKRRIIPLAVSSSFEGWGFIKTYM